MGVVSKATILGYLGTVDEAVLNQINNILESHFHKTEGLIVKSITDVDGYTVVKFSDDSEKTFAPKEIIDVLIANQVSGFIARKNFADLPVVGDVDTAYLVLDDATDADNNGTWGWNGASYYQANKSVAEQNSAEIKKLVGLLDNYSSKIATLTGLKIHYPFSDATGNIVNDTSVHSYNGVYKNSPDLTKFGVGDGLTAAYFDGINDFVLIDNQPFCNDFDPREGTINLLVKFDESIMQDDLSHYLIYFKGVVSGNSIYLLKSSDGSLIFQYSANGVVRSVSSGNLTTDWLSITISFSYTQNQIRLNVAGKDVGVFAGEVGEFQGILHHDKMFIGSTTGGGTSLFKGMLAHFSLSNQFLSLEEINKKLTLKSTDITITDIFKRISKKTMYRSDLEPNWLGRPALTKIGVKWFMLYKQSEGHNSAGANTFIHLRVSEDEGVSWSEENKLTNGTAIVGAPIAKQVGNTNQPQAIFINCPNGDTLIHVYETGVATGTYQHRSVDGGTTWIDEGIFFPDSNLVGEEDYTVKGNNIFIIVRDVTTDHNENSSVYKSTDNGLNWTKVSDIETQLDTNECSICFFSDNDFISIQKGSDRNSTWLYRSYDNCESWSYRSNMIHALGVIQKPRLYYIDSVLYLIGRKVSTEINTPDNARNSTVIFISYDKGERWSEAFFPDEYSYLDTGYCDFLIKTNGDVYMLSYAGTTHKAAIKEYIFNIK
jgi:hypothetical protein